MDPAYILHHNNLFEAYCFTGVSLVILTGPDSCGTLWVLYESLMGPMWVHNVPVDPDGSRWVHAGPMVSK